MHGVRKHEKYSQRGRRAGGGRGGGGVGRGGAAKRYPTQAIQTNGPQIQREWQRGRRGRGAEIRKKRLVMSMLSVTSFVDSHRVSMTTVKSLSGERYKTLELHLF